MEQKRLFLAIPIPEAIQQELYAFRTQLTHPDLRWTPPANLHVTLLFIGGVPITEVVQIEHTLQLLNTIPAFTLQFTRIQGVTRKRVTSMLWAAMEPNESFTRLAQHISQVLAIPLDHAPVPHVTVARTSRNSRYRLGAEPPPLITHLQVRVTGFELWESRLGPGGSKYHCLQRFVLA